MVFVVFPNLPINWVIGDMWFDIIQRKNHPGSSNINLSAKVGLIERTLYVGSILWGKPEFIGIWLVLKVAGRFWKDEKVREANGNDAAQQAIFQIFLIGSGLSIVCCNWSKMYSMVPFGEGFFICVLLWGIIDTSHFDIKVLS
jgi:hypothetical protein